MPDSRGVHPGQHFADRAQQALGVDFRELLPLPAGDQRPRVVTKLQEVDQPLTAEPGNRPVVALGPEQGAWRGHPGGEQAVRGNPTLLSFGHLPADARLTKLLDDDLVRPADTRMLHGIEVVTAPVQRLPRVPRIHRVRQPALRIGSEPPGIDLALQVAGP